MDRIIKLDPSKTIEELTAVFIAGLRGEPFPDSTERKKRVLSKLSEEANEDWENALLKLPTPSRTRSKDELYEAMLTEVEIQEELFKDGNPLSLLRCFTKAMNLGIYPPVSVLNAINDAFLKILTGKRTVKLDHLLGITGKSQGKPNAFILESTEDRQCHLATVMFGLSEGCGLSVMEAADRLSWFLERTKRQSYTVESLIQLYSKKWKKRYLGKYTSNHSDHPKNWSSSLKTRLLQRYAARK